MMTRFRKRMSISVFLLGSFWFLTGCASVTAPETLSHLEPQPLQGNCALTSMDAPGQGLHAMGTGLHAMGTIGGLFINDKATSDSNNPADSIASLTSVGDFSAHRNVGIIVLDKFSSPGNAPAYGLGNDISNLIDAAANGEAALEDTFNTLQHNGQVSHGALVLAHMHALLSNAPGTSFEYQADERTFVYKRGDYALVIKAVDVAGLNSADMVGVLDSAAASLAHSDYLGTGGIHNYTVNMSFALVPCEVLAPDHWEHEGIPYDSLENYLVALEADGIDANAYLLTQGDTVAEDDPLLWYLKDLPDNGHAVASAGNYSRDYPMYPALIPDVLSVASFNSQSGATSSAFTNSGEVAAPGWLFHIYDPVSDLNIPEILYAGTSFSSPAVALYAAFDLAAKDPWCYETNPANLLSHDLYNNVALSTAISSRCTSYQMPTIPLPISPIPGPKYPWGPSFP